MWTDAVDLRDFYKSNLGRTACRAIQRRVRSMWPDVRGQTVLGLGYATPYLRPFRAEAERVLALMPAPQGVLHWPVHGPGLVALGDEADLPFPENAFDRVLLVHALESSEQLRPMLREVWRVLAGNGRVMMVAPNRRGIWARIDSTPFGHGHPYTHSQLSRLLRDNMFTPVQSAAALYVPPSASPMLLAAAPAWEKMADRLFRTFAGVVLIEASKQIYAATATPAVRRRRPIFVPIPKGAARARDGAAGTFPLTPCGAGTPPAR
jgi:SAM-dependent methyltransferase